MENVFVQHRDGIVDVSAIDSTTHFDLGRSVAAFNGISKVASEDGTNVYLFFFLFGVISVALKKFTCMRISSDNESNVDCSSSVRLRFSLSALVSIDLISLF